MNLGTMHQYVCEGCGKSKEPGPHSAHCNSDVLTCYICGATDVEFDVEKMVHSIEYVSIGAKHQKVCKRCGYAFEPELHRAECTNPTTCYICNLSGVELDEENLNHKSAYVNLGVGHQWACIYCGYSDSDEELRPHEVYCDNLTTCYICDATGIEIAEEEIRHRIEAINMGETHQFRCVTCGKIDWEEIHFSYCDKPGICAGCGIEGVTIGRENHLGLCYVDLGTKHQECCSTCGYQSSAEEHWAYCNESTKCRKCGLTGVTVPNDRYTHRGSFSNEGDSHSFACNYCDYTSVEKHYVKCTDQSKCYVCGATGFEITWENRYCTGYVDYLSKDASNHTFYCSDCKKNYTEPHVFDDEGICICGYEKPQESDRLPGDADNSTGITLADAVVVLQYCASKTTSINTSNADVTGDGEVDAKDALRILQHEAGWNVTLK